VKNGDKKGEAHIGRAINHLIAAVPHLDAQGFDEMFAAKIQDLLMVLYLTNVTRTHVALADRINGLL
jgi:translation initiation factor 3 subunit F